MLCECFLGIKPHWSLWKRIFGVKRQGNYQTGGFRCFTRTEVKYCDLKTPENNQGWRSKCFYLKDYSIISQESGCGELSCF
jgi:hypothetical protein